MQSAKIDILKAKLANDVFSTQAEAYVRSMDMGFEGATHVTEDQMGQAFYMPALLTKST
jgi:serine protease inhibitor